MFKKSASILLLLVTPIFYSCSASAHGGGKDSNGGHFDRKTGNYHCHGEPCFQLQQVAARATQEAVEAGREFSPVYNRESWRHWSDFDGDCKNTRHEILKEQSVDVVRLSPDGCFVSGGKWIDPYSGKTFVRASELDVDHIVPLKWASDHGGALWGADQKERFANDTINLLAVDGGLNKQKGAKGPYEWLPPNHLYRCIYLGKWVNVLSNYPSLVMRPNEARIFKKQLQACGVLEK